MFENLLTLTIPGPDGKPVEVQAPSGIPTGGLESDGGQIITYGLTLLLIFAVLLSFGFIIYGGLNFIMSEGDKTKVESARRTILYALIGLLVAFLSFFVISFFGTALGVNYFNISL